MHDAEEYGGEQQKSQYNYERKRGVAQIRYKKIIVNWMDNNILLLSCNLFTM